MVQEYFIYRHLQPQHSTLHVVVLMAIVQLPVVVPADTVRDQIGGIPVPDRVAQPVRLGLLESDRVEVPPAIVADRPVQFVD